MSGGENAGVDDSAVELLEEFEDGSEGEDEEEETGQDLSSGSEDSGISFRVEAEGKKYERREYQIFLFQQALERNVILCLPTGSGKTFVAAQVARHMHPELQREKKKIIFLAPTVPLTHQQAKYFHDVTGIYTHIITGEQKPEDWNGNKWKGILDVADMYAMTPMVLLQALTKGFVRWNILGLLILDECHNAVGDHPMAEIMELYRKARLAQPNMVPRILGLSATIVIGKAKTDHQVKEGIQDMQNKMCAQAITYDDWMEVLRCSTSATVELVMFGTTLQSQWPPNLEIFKKQIRGTIVNTCKTLKLMEGFYYGKKLKKIPQVGHSSLRHVSQLRFRKKQTIADSLCSHAKNIEEVLDELGPYCAINAILSKSAFACFKKIKERLNRKNPLKATKEETICQYFKSQMDYLLRVHQNYIAEWAPENQAVFKMITPKLQELVTVLSKERNRGSDNVCGIIFCQKRIMTQMLCYYLQDLSRLCPEQYGFIKSSFALGSASKRGGYAVAAESQAALKKQQEVLSAFRKKEINILVATNVIEEGLDVPNCNFICRFDRIDTFPSFIQSMGRARQKDARFYALVSAENHEKISKKIADYRRMSTSLNASLAEQVLVPEKYFLSQVNLVESELNRLVPPFKPTDGPQQITANSAHQIVYQYCNGLSRDKLAVLSPIAWFNRDSKTGKYKVFVRLPPSACVSFVEGQWFANKDIAKKAAFVDVCKELYRCGALYSETLLPIPPQALVNMDNFIAGMEGEMSSNRNGKKIGAKNSTEWYPKLTPALALHSSCIEQCQTVRLFEVKFRLTNFFGHPENSVLFDFSENPHSFGIITTLDLHSIPNFLLFSKEGNIRVDLTLVSESFQVNTDVLESVKSFQKIAFCTDAFLLNLEHPVLAESSETYWMIVPLLKASGRIQMDTVLMDELCAFQHTEVEDIPRVDVNQTSIGQDLEDAVVISCCGPRKAYCVLKVDHSVSPVSCFETKNNGVYNLVDYCKYYKEKYNVDIVHRQGPMIRAKAIDGQLNYLNTPFGLGDKFVLKAESTTSALYLVPELVQKHPIPASLFVQLKLIPSTLHRIERLILAQRMLNEVSENFECRLSPTTVFSLLEKEIQDLDLKAYEAATLQPKDSRKSSSNVATENDGCPVLQVLTTCKRKAWAEIEYIHPKQVIMDDLRNLEDLDDLEDETATSQVVVNSNSTERWNNRLIPLSSVPSQHLDTFVGSVTQPLVTSYMRCMTMANGRDYMSYEKEEMIGDAVLKCIVTLHLFFHFSEEGEGRLTALRTALISNKHLFKAAGEKKDLGGYLAGSLFSPEKAWLPPGMTVCPNVAALVTQSDATYSVLSSVYLDADETVTLPSLLPLPANEEEIYPQIQYRMKYCKASLSKMDVNHTTFTHSRLGDKYIADCVEALIGAHYLSGGISGALKFMEWVGLRGPTNEKPARETVYKDIPSLPTITHHRYQKSRVLSTKSLQELEQLLNYKFKHPGLLDEAFTDSTAFVDKIWAPKSYERLEFLGDAVLDFLVTNFIYKSEKMKTPGQLTDLRSALVNNETFATLAVRYGLQKLFRHSSQKLDEAISNFVQFQEKNDHRVTLHGTFELVNRPEVGTVYAVDVYVPKQLGDLFESLAGAVFIDCGRSLDTTWKIFYRLMKHEFDLFLDKTPIQPFRELSERFPNKVKVRKEDVAGKRLVEISIVGQGVFCGHGDNFKSARGAAAKYAAWSLLHKNAKY